VARGATLHDARDWLCLNAEGAAAARLATVFGGAREVTRRPQRWGWSQWPLGASTPDSGASGLHRDAMSSKRALLTGYAPGVAILNATHFRSLTIPGSKGR
jgi:hypothetical protein